MTFELNDVSDMYDIQSIDGEGARAYGSIAAPEVHQSMLSARDACDWDKQTAQKVLAYIKTVNDVLERSPFKIAYRSRNEILIYCLERIKDGKAELPQALDEVTSMKILARIEGDDQKLALVNQDDAETDDKTVLDRLENVIPEARKAANDGNEPTVPCNVCREKIIFMKNRLKGGFTNFFV